MKELLRPTALSALLALAPLCAPAQTPDTHRHRFGDAEKWAKVFDDPARLARFVPKGRVYGVDTEPGMVKYLAERARREGLVNLVSIAGRPADPRLPAKVDLALMVDVYHHIAGREEYFRRLRGSLKAGGRVAIIDFRPDSERGPPKRERISPERVKAEMGEAGYAAAKEYAFLPNQYFLVFEPGRN